MANIRKSFNFRTGLQVDNDNFVVNANGLVGIGTSIPQNYLLNVHGGTRVTGLVTTGELYAGIGTIGILSATSADVSGNLTVGSINVAGSGALTDLVGYAYTAWITDNGGVGLHTTSKIGVNTTTSPGASDSYFTVRGDASIKDNLTVTEGDLILTSGDIDASSGIVTALSFDGDLNATDLTSGTVNNSRLPSNINVSGVVTATTFVGALTGTATTATSLTGSPNITVTDISASDISASDISASNITLTGIVTASDVNVSGIVTASNVSVTGIVTATTELNVGSGGTALTALSTGRLGIGTALPTSSIQIIKQSVADVEILSETTESKITLGQGVGVGNSASVIRFGNDIGAFEILNRDIGNINMFIHAGNPGINTGRFEWIYGQSNERLMSLTYQGKLGLGKTNPDQTLYVVGTSTVTSDSSVGGSLNVAGNLTVDGTINGTVSLPSIIDGNINATSGVSTFIEVTANRLGINTDSPLTDFDAQGSTGLFGSIGIGTTALGAERLNVREGTTLLGAVGIGTTELSVSGNFALIQIYDERIDLENSAVNVKGGGSIGFNTTTPRSVFDYGNVGSATTRPVVVVPNINNATITGIAITPTGSIIFNTTTSKFQGYTGVAWVDFH